jgi:hypothetical protein
MAESHSFSEDAARRIANVVRLVETAHPQLRRGGSNRPAIQVILEGAYQADLDSPDVPADGDDLVPTTATFRAYRGAGDDWALDSTEANEITVTNRNTDFSAAEDDYGIVAEVNGEWRPISAGGGGGLKLGKASAFIAKGTSGSCALWSGPTVAGVVATGDSVTAYARTTFADSGKWVYLWKFPWGWEIVGKEC